MIYGVIDKAARDPRSRVNTFVHVNHEKDRPRYGVLLCVNGTGILNSWMKHNVMASGGEPVSYEKMNELASAAPAGSEGLLVLPYGNGAERTLGDLCPGASVRGLDFNVHKTSHLLRAAQEGIVFALGYGLEIMSEMGVGVRTVRAGRANMFLSPLFCQAFAAVTGAVVELFETDGAQGAARGAGLGAGIYSSMEEAFAGLEMTGIVTADAKTAEVYAGTYQRWRGALERELSLDREPS